MKKWYIVFKGSAPAIQVDNILHEQFADRIEGYGDKIFKGTEEEFDKLLAYYNSLFPSVKIIGCGELNKT